MKKLLALFIFCFSVAMAAQVSPQIQGAGAPTNPCVNGGQQYVDTTNHVLYNCSVPGQNWVNIGLGNATGGGGVSTSAGVVALFTGCSGTQYLGADGACHASTPVVPGAPISGLSSIAGLLAEYNFLDGSGTTAADSSGNGNNATLTAAHLPTWIPTGGLTFAGNQSVDLPAAINTAKTFLFAIKIATPQSIYNPIIGGSSASNCNSIILSINGVPNANWQAVGTWSGSNKGTSYAPITGTHVLAVVEPGSVTDLIYEDGVDVHFATAFSAAQTSGNWELGAPGACGGVSGNYLTGSIYYAAFWSSVLTPGQIIQATSFISSILANRTTPVSYGATAGTTVILGGDSEMSNLAIPSTTIFLPAGTNVWNVGISGETSATLLSQQPTNDLAMIPTTGRFITTIWSGTNDTPGQEVATVANQATFCRGVHVKGGKCIVGTMLSRTGRDSMKNTMNALYNSQWASFADAEINFAINANMGADGASANTLFFTDGIHTTTAAKDNILDRQIHTFLNRMLFGNNNFDQAAVYTTTAPAATAITATSESTNTVTVTTTLNPPTGSCAVITGVTPAGYNNQANVPCYMVLTTAGANFTYFNFNSGLGAGTVFGTVSVPLQKEVDNFVRLAGSATSPSFTLLSCQEWSNGDGPTIRNENTTSPWVLTPMSGETINAQATFTMPTATTGHFQTVKLASVQVSTAAGGCNWTTQQP